MLVYHILKKQNGDKTMQHKINNPIAMIDRNAITYESTVETIKLLIAVINPEIKKEYLDRLMNIIGWTSTTNDLNDYNFMFPLLSDIDSKIQQYFIKKDLDEMEAFKEEELSQK